MILLWLPIGLFLPTLTGWLLLRLFEGQSPVLLRLERWVMGFLVGITFTMFATFLMHLAGLVLFTRSEFLSVQIGLVVFLSIARLFQWKRTPHPNPNLIPSRRSPLWIRITLILALLWTVVKVLTGSFILSETPSYFDDTLKNWNYRAKIFALTGALDSAPSPAGEASPLSGYPPTVSLVKTWLATLSNQWNDGLINSIHALWFLASLALLYCALRRRVPWTWALGGSLILGSLPLNLFHGVNAYADVYVAAHLFAAASLMWTGLTEEDPARRRSLLRLSALATALLIFTKNEALLLHLPLLLALLVTGLIVRLRRGTLPRGELVQTLLWFTAWLLAIAGPWLLYKWTHGLAFGNAKALSSGYSIGWQPGVLWTIWINIFFEGNWHLLFPLLLLLLFARGRSALRSPIGLLLIFVTVAILLQLSLFLFTSLSAEALKQTGIGRGFVQMAPLIVLLVTLWVREVFEEY